MPRCRRSITGQSGPSGLEKRQCTVQLTVFAKWECSNMEQKRFAAIFQIKAWCDEEATKKWVSEQWGDSLLNPPTNGSSGKILFAQIHKAQQTDTVKIITLKKHKTTLINVPGGPGCFHK